MVSVTIVKMISGGGVSDLTVIPNRCFYNKNLK